MNMKKKNAKGFTLIELLIVVAIIGILSAILIPNLLSARERGRVANTQGVIKAAASAAEQFAVDNAFYPNRWDLATIDRANRTGGFDALDPGGQRYLTFAAPAPKDGWATDLTYVRGTNVYKAIVASPGRDRLLNTGTGFDMEIWTCMPGGRVEVSTTAATEAAADACL